MKTLEIVKKYIAKADMNKNDVKKLVNYAYYLGRHEATRECCKSANKVFMEQIQRAKNSHFKNFALKIQGNIHTIYHTDYNDDYVKMFNDDFEGVKDTVDIDIDRVEKKVDIIDNVMNV